MNSLSPSRLGSQARAGPSTASICIQASSSLAMATSSLGVTYNTDIADQRESPAAVIGRKLSDCGADLVYHDPHVATWSPAGGPVRRAADPYAEAAAADLVILLQNHSDYHLDLISRAAGRVLDTRGCLAGPNVERL